MGGVHPLCPAVVLPVYTKHTASFTSPTKTSAFSVQRVHDRGETLVLDMQLCGWNLSWGLFGVVPLRGKFGLPSVSTCIKTASFALKVELFCLNGLQGFKMHLDDEFGTRKSKFFRRNHHVGKHNLKEMMQQLIKFYQQNKACHSRCCSPGDFGHVS